METIKATCPTCGTTLSVPVEALGKSGRCAKCGGVFPIELTAEEPDPGASVSDEDVLDWLGGDGGASATAAAAPGGAQAVRGQEDPAAPGPSAARPAGGPPPAQATAAPQAAPHFPVVLGHLDDMGVFLLFEPRLLYEERFRGSFAQRCVVCGRREHLSVHLIIWSAKLPERGRIGAHTGFFRTVMELDKLGRRRGRELLVMLPRVENLPEPYCLPFPYYVCRTCSPVGAIVPDVRISEGLGEVCELGISALPTALEFTRGVCGEDCPTYEAIHKAIRQGKGDPWRSIPLAIRVRIGQWYQPQEGENFVAYFPDGDFAKTEAGMAGIVLTDRRMVYRKFAAVVEVRLSEKVTIRPVADGAKTKLHIVIPGRKEAVFSGDEFSTDQIRRHLSRCNAQAEWVQ